jgi:hypothetical protein
MLKNYLLAAALGFSFAATPVWAAPEDTNDASATQSLTDFDDASTGARSATSSSGEPLSPGEDRRNIAADSAGDYPAIGGGDPNRAWPINRLRL